jgi:hypothetical protein
MFRRHWIFVAVFSLCLIMVMAVPLAGHAQELVTIKELTIRIWPEFDQPTVLVFYVGRVAEGTPLPVDLRFQMPAGASLHATAYIDTDGTLLDAPARAAGDSVTLTSPNGTFWVEFYDPALQRDEDQRAYSFIWQSEYPVRQLTWEVQLPAGGSDLSVDPTGGSFTTDQYGLPMYTVTVNGPAAGETASLSAAYVKTTDTLSVETFGPSVASTAVPPSQSGGLPLWAIIVLVVASVALVGGAVYYFIQDRKRVQERKGKKGRASPPIPSQGKRANVPRTPPAVTTRFCTRCGHPIGQGDQFCRNCGAKLR